MKAVLARIDDLALYPGSVVKELLRKAAGYDEEALRWLELADAANLLARRPDTLRRQCAKWQEMDDPPVRVRKKGPADGSHWLLAEQDVYGLARARRPLTFGVRAVEEEEPEVGNEEEAAPAVDTEEATVAAWCEEATRNY